MKVKMFRPRLTYETIAGALISKPRSGVIAMNFRLQIIRWVSPFLRWRMAKSLLPNRMSI